MSTAKDELDTFACPECGCVTFWRSSNWQCYRCDRECGDDIRAFLRRSTIDRVNDRLIGKNP